jgi:hypothetical protein
MADEVERAKPGRVNAVRLALARRWRSGGVWAGAAFVGSLFATAITGPIPEVANWQSAIVCGSSTHLSHDEYVTQVGAEQSSGGTVSSPGTGVGFTYHCVGPHFVSGSRTALVLGLQFVAGTLATYLFILLLAVRSSLRWKRRGAGHDLTQGPGPAVTP